GDVTAATVTALVTIASKTYDGTAGASLATCTPAGVVGTDAVTCGGGTAVFDTANVGAGKTVTVAGLSLSGVAASNYLLSNPSMTATGSITALTLTPTLTAASKVYDTTTSAIVTCSVTPLGTDVVSCTGTGTFDTPQVGIGKSVSVSDLSLSG